MTNRFPPFFYPSPTDAKQTVMLAEQRFNAQIQKAADYLLSSHEKVFGLAGPTCSGKTTTANKLKELISQSGKNLHIISTDDFYLDREYLIKNSRCEDGHIDFDSIETINLKALEKCICMIDSQKDVEIPVFDFVSGKATHTRRISASENDIFLLEGIHAITPEVAALMPKENDYTGIYIDVSPDSLFQSSRNADGRTVRLARRIIRDFRFRNASPEFTLSLWKNVVSGEEKGLMPYKDACKIKINSYLSYELSVIKEPLERLISDMPEKSKYSALVNSLEMLVDGVSPLDSGIVPKGSVYREFIG